MYEQLLQIVIELFTALIALLALGFGTERGTELVKNFLRLIGQKFPALDFSKGTAFIIAAVFAFTVTYYFKVDLAQFLPLLDGFDADLVQMITALLTMLFSNALHDKYLSAG